MKYETQPQAISCTILDYEVLGLLTHCTGMLWVKNSKLPDGGYYKEVKRKHKTPKIGINFRAVVDVDLLISGTYSDGVNLFVAVAPNTIVNQNMQVDTFNIPKELMLVSSHYNG